MRKILLVENDQMILENNSTFLNKEGYQVYATSNVDDAVRIAQGITPDIVISGLNYRSDEFEICKVLQLNEQTALVPVVFITSNPDKIQSGLSIGAADFLSRHYSYEQLLESISINSSN